MNEEAILGPFLRPMREGGRPLGLAALFLSVLSAWWLYFLIRLLAEGHVLYGTSSYGAFWGVGVANIVHVIGISHVGIAVSASVRLLRLERYRNVARMAEILTLVCLVGAVLGIATDVGRPERLIARTLVHGRWHAPMVWSMTVISLYFMASAAYLYLSLRQDLWRISRIGLRGGPVYRLLSLGYRDTAWERARHQQVLLWLAVALLPIMVSVHSVYGMIFGLLAPKAGWYNPLQGPYFVLAAIVSGFSAIIAVAAALRRAFSWQNLLPDRIFKVLGSVLAFVVFLYLYFLASEHLTAQYAHAPAEKEVSSALLYGSLSGLFWPAVVVGLLLPLIYLLAQGLGAIEVSVGWTTAAAVAVNLALWTKRVLLVVPAQMQSHLPLPRPVVPYIPSWAEVVLTAGIYAVAGLAFLGLLRVVPVIELPDADAGPERAGPAPISRGRRHAVLATLGAAAFMIAWGVLTSAMPFAPLKWILGLALLVLVPLEWCLIPDRPLRTAGEGLPAQPESRETT